MKKKITWLAVLFCFALLSFAVVQGKAAWPDPEQTINVVVPYSAGGGTDLIFRPIVEEMKKHTKANIIVSNISGAGSSKGTNEVLNLPADGYTVLRTRPWKTMKELVEGARKNPGKISLGNAGMGGATGVASVGLNLAFGKAFNVTPFSGGKNLRANVLGGHCDVGIFSQSEMLANRDKLQSLVILYTKRSVLPDLRDVPTLKEAGYRNLTVPGGSFRAFSVKKGTPEAVKNELAKIVRKANNSAAFQAFMKQRGLLPAYYELGRLDGYFKELVEAYIPILKTAGLLKQ
jgi:tripartite-type tricarboxylate transporter receptor subunit TctC